MRERAGLFLLALIAVAFFLFALSREQHLVEERKAAAGREKGLALQIESFKKQLLDAEKEKQAACQKWTETEGQVRQASAQIKTFLDKADLIQKDNASRDQALQVLTGKLQARLDELSAGVGEIKGSVAKLKTNEALFQAERDHHQEDVHQRDLDLAALRKEVDSMKKRSSPLPPREDEKPAPVAPVSTSIEAVEPSTGAVVLGAGKNSGLEPGHILYVSREGKPIARVKVLKVYEDLSGAAVLETQTGESIQKNDRAETDSLKTASRPPQAQALPLKKMPSPPPLPEGGRP